MTTKPDPKPFSDAAPYLADMNQRIRTLEERQFAGEFEELFAKSEQLVPHLIPLMRGLHETAVDLAGRQSERLMRLNAVTREVMDFETAAKVAGAAASKDEETIGREVRNDPKYVDLEKERRTRIVAYGTVSRDLKSVIKRIDRANQLWGLIESGQDPHVAYEEVWRKPFDPADKLQWSVPSYPNVVSEETFPPAPEGREPGQEELLTAVELQDYDIDLQAMAGLDEENRERYLLHRGVDGETMDRALRAAHFVALRMAGQGNGATPGQQSGAPAGSPAGGAVPPGNAQPANAGSVTPGAEMRASLYEASGAMKIESETTRMASEFTNAVLGEHVTRRALESLRLDPAAFVRELTTSATSGGIVDTALIRRRDTLVSVSHPFAKIPNVSTPLPFAPDTPATVPPPAWMKLTDTATERPLAVDHLHHLRDLARLVQVSQLSRKGGTLRHPSGLNIDNPKSWGEGVKTPPVFRDWKDLNEFGESCQQTLEHAQAHETSVSENIRQRIIQNAGTMPLALARAYESFACKTGALVVPPREQARIESDFENLVGNRLSFGTFGNELDKSEIAKGAVELHASIADAVTNAGNWNQMKGLIGALTGGAHDAHFRRGLTDAKDQSNVMLPEEIDLIRTFKCTAFANAYQHMEASERLTLLRDLKTAFDKPANATTALEIYCVTTHSLYREERELVGNEISGKWDEYGNALRVNAEAAKTRYKAWQVETERTIQGVREKVGQKGRDYVEQGAGMVKNIADITKGSGNVNLDSIGGI